MKYLLFLLLLTSCAGRMVVFSHREKTACGAALGVKIEAYFEKCDDITIIEIERQSDGTYIGKGECYKRKR